MGFFSFFMRDFTLSLYHQLIGNFKAQDYLIRPSAGQQNQHQKAIILRHDIDAMPVKALSMAKIEHKAGIRSSWFFKSGTDVFVPGIVREMASLHHEIGYHYEDLARNHGNYSKAISEFERNLDALRKVFPVTTICADGNPLSKYNNLWLWERYDYKRYGITCEMYLDIDYNEYAYYTDTGRCWDGTKYNVWDHVKTDKPWPRYHNTYDILRAIDTGTFPIKAALNIHPQRWNDNPYDWAKELVLQNAKNVVRLGLLKSK
jgi:hypothetical protein